MAAAVETVSLPESILRHAEVQAQREGITKEEWIRRMTELRLDTDEGARKFFRQRSKGATGEGLKRWLDSLPDAPPMPGDELD